MVHHFLGVGRSSIDTGSAINAFLVGGAELLASGEPISLLVGVVESPTVPPIAPGVVGQPIERSDDDAHVG